MRVLVTGATGLIGAEVAHVLSRSHEVVRAGRRPSSQIAIDLRSIATIQSADLGADAIVHCAGVVDEDFADDAAGAFYQATCGMAALLDRAKACGTDKFVYFSTSHVYGRLQGVIDESTCPNPLSGYAIAHYASEQMVRRFYGESSRALIVRPNAVFGAPADFESFDRWSLIPYAFPREAVLGGRITLRTPGTQQRNFVSTRDLARGVGAWIENAEAAGNVQVWNPVGPATLSIFEFAQACASVYAQVTGRRCEIERPLPSPDDPRDSFAFRSSQSALTPTETPNEYLREIITRLNTARRDEAAE